MPIKQQRKIYIFYFDFMTGLIKERKHSSAADICRAELFTPLPVQLNERPESGFTLVEVVVAMVVLMIALLGVFGTFTYAINYNAGNNSRAQALAVLQQEVELLRSAKFTPTMVDTDLQGGAKTPKTVTAANGNMFRVQVEVDDDPLTAGIQINTTKTIKEISITVSLANPTPGWQTSVPATVILRRVRGN
jgi:type II secretory pathway pseudopilin PulG